MDYSISISSVFLTICAKSDVTIEQAKSFSFSFSFSFSLIQHYLGWHEQLTYEGGFRIDIEVRFSNITSTLHITGCHFGVKPPGWSYPNHHHHLFELLYCWSGEVTHIINDRELSFQAGDWLLLKSGVKHQTKNDAALPYSFFNVHFDIDDPDMRKLLSSAAYQHIARHKADQTQLPAYTEQIELLLQAGLLEANRKKLPNDTPVPLAFTDKISLLAYILLIIKDILSLLCSDRQSEDGLSQKSSSTLEADTAYAIEEKLKNSIIATGSVTEIAKELNLSRSQCSKVFTKIYGISPRQYISQRKLNQARQLLVGSNHTIEAISKQLGFSSVSHFSRQFRRWTGMTPNQFRPKHTIHDSADE